MRASFFAVCLWLIGSAPLQQRLVSGRKECANRHEKEGRNVGCGRRIAENDQGKSRPDEGRYGVVSPRPSRPQHPLGVHVTENAHAVSHESDRQSGGDCHEGGGAFTEEKPDGKRSETRKNAFEQDDDQGILARQPPCAVVLYAPAQAGSQDEQRPRRQAKDTDILKGEKRAGVSKNA